MREPPPAGGGPWTLGGLTELLDRCYPRLIGQVDRDPDAPTWGSADRGFWMYRLHDFDSGVLQQMPLTLAAAVRLADAGALDGARWMRPEFAGYWREIAAGISRRTVRLLERNGFLDEYYPGERSYPGTVFAAYATLKAARLLDLRDVIGSRGLRRTYSAFLERPPSPAANQDAAAAAFLGLFAQLTGERREEAGRRIEALLEGPDGQGRFLEYGGMDLGYATVTLNSVACLHEDGAHPVGDRLVALAEALGRTVSPFGRIGGEFASRSTTYFLPYGVRIALRNVDAGSAATALARLDVEGMLAKLDDRYLGHYAAPSLALAALDALAHPAVPARPLDDAWVTESDGKDSAVLVRRTSRSVAMVGLRKGGTLQVGTAAGVTIDCGYRVNRAGRSYATAVLGGSTAEVASVGGSTKILVHAPFLRYRALVASPLKTVVLRILRLLGPAMNTYFKKRLITAPVALEGVRLVRRITIESHKVQVVDRITGLRADDLLRTAPAVSPRLVPSARFHQAGEETVGLGTPVAVAGGIAAREVTILRDEVE